LAYRSAGCRPEAVDLTKETEATRKLYGMDNEVTAKFGTNCCWPGAWWSAACVLWSCISERQRLGFAHRSDRPSRTPLPGDRRTDCLLTDLKARGLLDSTLVVWGGVRPHAVQ
jgi:hypothetical protein